MGLAFLLGALLDYRSEQGIQARFGKVRHATICATCAAYLSLLSNKELSLVGLMLTVGAVVCTYGVLDAAQVLPAGWPALFSQVPSQHVLRCSTIFVGAGYKLHTLGRPNSP